MSDVATALTKVDNFKAEPVQTVAWQLDRADVLHRLRELLQNPNLLDQRGLNACAPAVFFRAWFARDPVSAATFACTLLRDGSASIGSLTVAPSSKLLARNYATLRSVTDAKHPNVTPECTDWMLLSALRDSENIWFDYAGEPFTLGDSVAGLTLPSTLAGWFSATNLYSTVANETTLISSDLTRLLGMTPTSDIDVVLFINANAIYDLAATPGPPIPSNPVIAVPNHYVLMTAPFAQADSSNWLNIDVWTWGRIIHGWQKEPCFIHNYFGLILAKA